MSDDRGVMSSQEPMQDSPVAVTLEPGKGTLDTWRFHRHRGGRTQSRRQADTCGGARLWANHGGWGVCEPALKPLRSWVGPWRKGQGFKPDRGNPAVRDYRGASGNVAMVEMRSHLAIERARLVALHLQPARRSSIPTMSVYQDGCGPLGNLPKACLSHSQCNSPVTVRLTTATGQLQKTKRRKKIA